MSEAVSPPERQFTELVSPPSLSIVDSGRDRVRIVSTEPVREGRYPDLEFTFSPQHFVSSGVIETSPDLSVKAVLWALSDIRINGKDLGNLDLDTRQGHIGRVKSYFSHAVNIGGEKIRRKHLVNHDAAVQTVLSELAQTNHPVFQVLDQVNKQFAADLDDAALGHITRTVLTHTHWKRLRTIYNSQVDQLRQARQSSDDA